MPQLHFSILLNVKRDQFERLQRLQTGFAALCNELTPFVSEQQCWNRVTLHHLKYKELRAKFSEMGSQMICNAIYAVSKVSRLVYQHPSSPYHAKKLVGKKLPIIRFGEDCPVYFDSHTLTVSDHQLSMFTMDGRIKFELTLAVSQRQLLASRKLLEITLTRTRDDEFMLTFVLEELALPADQVISVKKTSIQKEGALTDLSLPEYVGVEVAK